MKKLALYLLFLVVPLYVHAQGVLVNLPPITNSMGQPIAGVTVSVFTASGSAGNLTCGAAQPIFSNVTLTTPINPLATNTITTDGFGNFPFYISPVAQTYGYTVTGQGTNTAACYGFVVQVTPGSSPTFAALTVTGALTAQSIEKIVYLDQFADMAAAVAALPSGGEVHVPCGNYNLPTSAVAINVNGIHIRGEGFCSNLQITSTNDNFAITAAVFQVYGVQFTVTTASSRNGKAVFHVTGASGSQGRAENIRWTPAVGPDSGLFFLDDTNGTGQWQFKDVSTVGGSTQPITGFIRVSSGGPSSVSVISLDKIWGAVTCTDACIVLDGFIDTFKMNDVLWSQVGGSCLGPQFWARNTVGSGTNPRWIFTNNVQFECPGGTAIKLDASREFQYTNSYVATAATGIAIGANAVETKIAYSMFTNIATNGITVAATATDTLIIGDTFTDCGNNADNASDCISLAATTSRFNIDFNHFRLTGANRSRNSIFIAAGGSTDLHMFGNDGTGAFGTALISNGANGANQHVLGNVPLQPTGTEVLTNPLNLNALVTCNNVIQSGGGNFAINCVSNKVTAYGGVATGGTGLAPNYGTPVNLTGQVANLGATTIYTTASGTGIGAAGLYRVCVATWTTSTGNTAALQANAIAPSGAGTVTVPVGPVLNTAALTNGGGGCSDIHVAPSSAIQVSTTGYNTTGTYSIQATVEQVF